MSDWPRIAPAGVDGMVVSFAPRLSEPANRAALALRAAIEAPMTLAPGDAVLLPSGIAIHIEDPGLCAVVLPRSGLGHKKGLVLGNGTGRSKKEAEQGAARLAVTELTSAGTS